MIQPAYYKVTSEQIGKEDLTDFLRRAVARQFEGKEYYVSKETIEKKATPYSKEPRQLKGFFINEANTTGHIIYFDVTDVPNNIQWLGR